MEASSNSSSPSPETPVPPKTRRRWLRILLITCAVFALLIALLPLGLSTSFVRTRVTGMIAAKVRGPVQLAELSFSWTQGVTVKGLEIGNPPNYSTERPALRLREMVADASLGSLLFGSPTVTLKIDGLEVFVEQDEAGNSNLQDLAVRKDAPADNEPPSEPTSDEDAGSGDGLRDLALDVDVRHCQIEVRRSGQLLESMQDLELQARSESGSPTLTVHGATSLLAGNLGLDVVMDTASGEADANLVSHGLDLQSWKPLVDAFLPDQLTALSGKVDGELQAIVRADQRVELGGELIIAEPRIAGPIVRDMDLHSERWTIAPVLSFDQASQQDLDASKFAVNLGWLQLQGKPTDQAGTAHLAYVLDIAALAEFGGPIPEMLKGSGSTLAGALHLPASDLPTDAAGWIEAIALDADLRIAQLEVAGMQLRELGAAATIKDGAFALSTSEATKLDGGALIANAQIDLHDLDKLATKTSVSWQGGQLTGGATSALRYAMPLLAGIDADAAQFVGACNLALTLQGPAAKPDETSWLAWLDTWSGDGSLGLQDAAFAPSKALQGLLSPLGELSQGSLALGKNGQLAIDSFDAPFTFAKGFVKTTACEWLSEGHKIGLAGTVGLDGNVDYELDLAGLLRGHRDGEKVLKALDGKLPAARINGTLDAPALALPKLGDLAQTLLEQQGKDLLQKGLESLFKKKR